LRDDWWLLGGWGAGATLVFSGLVALALVVYSFRNFRGSADPRTDERGAGPARCT
jgi:hypothetical protein